MENVWTFPISSNLVTDLGFNIYFKIKCMVYFIVQIVLIVLKDNDVIENIFLRNLVLMIWNITNSGII